MVDWQRHVDDARAAVERWDVSAARIALEQARGLAAAWTDSAGVALAETIGLRAALLTSASPGQKLGVAESPPGHDPILESARRRLQIELATALEEEKPLQVPSLPSEPLGDDVAATAIAAVFALRAEGAPSRIPGLARVTRWPEAEGWRDLLYALEAEARGESGIPAVERALGVAAERQSRSLSWTALKLRSALCDLHAAPSEARATRARLRQDLERWALLLPAADAASALARPDRAKILAEDAADAGEPGPNQQAHFQLISLALSLSGERRLERLVDLALDAAISVTGAERGLLIFADPEQGHRVAASRTVDRLSEAQGLLGLSSTIARRALENREVIESSDVRSDPRFSECASLKVDVASVLCVPILARAELEGAIYLDRSRAGRVFSADCKASATAIGSMLAAALLNARVLGELETRGRELEAAREELSLALATRTVERDDMSRQLAEVRDVAEVGSGLVGRGPEMSRLLRAMERVAGSDAPVLISGETGAGKELVARAIHASGRRRDRPFVAINCGALSETLLEAELFGSERGAFTGATSSRPGLFVAAHGGTLLLDEVGDMPPAMQTALLRVLETCEVRAVGSTKPRPVDVRVIAATHRDLLELVRKGAFRDDLRYRLEVVTLVVPPLRERLEDMPELCQHLLDDARRRYGLPERRLSQPALDVLLGRRWAGNVRELRHVLASAALSASGALIAPEDLPPERAADLPDASSGSRLDIAGPDGHATRVQTIKGALRATAGHRARAAELLGISRSTLYRYLEIYEIDLTEFEPLGKAREEV